MDAPSISDVASTESAFSARSWLTLLATLLACLPPLLIDLGARVSTHTMENVAMVTSQETWLRWHEGEQGAWLVTSNDLMPRIEKPPMLTWLNFLAWADLDPSTSTPAQLTARARIVSVALGLVMLGSIFWMGNSLGGLRTAAIATLACGSTFFFQRQARWASYDIHFVAWATLSVAAAIWAMGPCHRAPGRWRRIAGWSICGLAMAASVMSKNPLAFVLIVLPIAAVIVVNPWPGGRGTPRVASTIGLLGASLLAAVLVVPWYLHVISAFPDTRASLQREFRQPRSDAPPFYYYLGLLGLVVPWSAWMICGLVQPFTSENRPRRRLLLVPWLWFAEIFIFFSIPEAKQQRYILPIIPAVALLVGQLVAEHQRLADSGRRDRIAQSIGLATWGLVIITSVLFGPFIAMQDWLVARGWSWYRLQAVKPVGWPAAISCSVMLLLVAVLGWREQRKWRPVRSAALLALWTIVAMTVYWRAYTGVPTIVSTYKSEAERVAAMVGGSPVRSLRIAALDPPTYKLNEEFRLYFGRLIRHTTPEQLASYAAGAGVPVYVLTKSHAPDEQVMREAGFRQVDAHVEADEKDIQELWVHDPAR